MRGRRFTPQEKARVVLEGLSGRPVDELCAAYGISRARFLRWRAQLVRNAGAAFAAGRTGPADVRLARENESLRRLVARLMDEFRTLDDLLGGS